MPQTIPEFNDGYTLKTIREDSLNPTIRAVKGLDLKVKGLQTVVTLSMTEPAVDVNGKKITFKQGGPSGTSQELDLGPMFDDFKHGIDISTDTGGYTDVFKVKFKNSTLTQVGDEVVVDFKPIEGQVASSLTRPIKHLFITGNTTGSSLTNDGIMTINIPAGGGEIVGQVGSSAAEQINTIYIGGRSTGSSVHNGTLTVNMPDKLQGRNEPTDAYQDVDHIQISGNQGSSVVSGGVMTIDIPDPITGEVENVPAKQVIKGVKVKGNRGNSAIVNDILEIDLPAGGSGGGSPLAVKAVGQTAITNVEEITFANSTVAMATTRTGNKVLVTPSGMLAKKETETDAKPVKQILLSGDIKDSEVDAGGTLKLVIPQHQGLAVEDAKTQLTGMEKIMFSGATVTSASGEVGKALVAIDRVQGQLLNGVESPVEKIKLIGDIGTSTLDAGLLTINLQAGGGGGGTGGEITGVVGSEAGAISRIEIQGNTTGSHVDIDNKILKVKVPNKPSIKGGSNVLDDIDIVEVANSIVELKEEGGKKTAFITPQIVMFFHGWFPSFDTLNAAVKEPQRIPTKTSAYITNAVTKQDELVMWMPNSTGGNEWRVIRNAGALSMHDNGNPTAPILSVQKNMMTEVDPQGVLTIRDTTIPDMPIDMMDESGLNVVQNGISSKFKFDDAVGSVDFNSTTKEVTIHRAQRRLNMGTSPDQTAPEYVKSPSYEGSIFMNTNDNCWWGYSNKDKSPGAKKWTRVIHPEMSGEVESLVRRLPQLLPNIMDIEIDASSGDCKQWSESGWTHIDKNSKAMPAHIRGLTGGYIETFVITNPDGGAENHRYQMLHVETDAATYKRYWKYEGVANAKWNDWVKISFNPAELAMHNADPKAHHLTHPFYKALTFGCLYEDISKAGFWVPLDKFKFLGASNGKHQNDGPIITIPYDGKFQIRGHISFHDHYYTGTETAGRWRIYIDRIKKGATSGEYIYEGEYVHNTTSMIYPPLKWDVESIDLLEGDVLKLGFVFTPNSGTHDQWKAKYPKLGFHHLRSYISIDEKGNDGGSGLGEMYRTVLGNFTSLDDVGVYAHEPSSGTYRVTGVKVPTNLSEFGDAKP